MFSHVKVEGRGSPGWVAHFDAALGTGTPSPTWLWDVIAVMLWAGDLWALDFAKE